MGHVTEGTLRRLVDEPVLVADRATEHVRSCGRCQRRAARIAKDAAYAAAVIAVPTSALGNAPRDLERPAAGTTGARARVRVPRHRAWRILPPSLGTGAAVALGGVVVAGVAAATTLTIVFAPTTVAPVNVGSGASGSVASLLGLGSSAAFAGFNQPSGTDQLADGTLSWSSAGAPRQVASLAAAQQATGLTVSLPTTLPNGVGAPSQYLAMEKVTATFTFNANAGSTLSGSTLTMTIGPGVGVLYGSASGSTTTMGVLAMTRPLVTSNGATTSELENFLVSKGDVPPALAAELAVIGNLQTTLPVPVPSGTQSSTVQIDGVPGVVLSDGTGAASAGVWEDQTGQVHVVAGLIDTTDLVNVARQIG